jgi:hypothetical protein
VFYQQLNLSRIKRRIPNFTERSPSVSLIVTVMLRNYSALRNLGVRHRGQGTQLTDPVLSYESPSQLNVLSLKETNYIYWDLDIRNYSWCCGLRRNWVITKGIVTKCNWKHQKCLKLSRKNNIYIYIYINIKQTYNINGLKHWILCSKNMLL